jgi:hypothetical protein
MPDERAVIVMFVAQHIEPRLSGLACAVLGWMVDDACCMVLSGKYESMRVC